MAELFSSLHCQYSTQIGEWPCVVMGEEYNFDLTCAVNVVCNMMCVCWFSKLILEVEFNIFK